MTIPIQTTSKDELPGGADNETRRGNESGSTDSMAFGSSRFCKGENVEAGSSPISGGARNDLNRGATVQGRTPERARPVDAKQVGSNPGDHRQPHPDTAKASVFKAAVGEGVRGPVGQTPNGKRSATLGSFSNDHADETFPAKDGN